MNLFLGMIGNIEWNTMILLESKYRFYYSNLIDISELLVPLIN